ncbi:MAG: acyl--CoA ligase [Phenylobacterium sp.]|uniref:class I adenylate-forming enzyme family protein n=1 Tax=Phenylobacterium sp. TaxID=1871053 RepID=UPI001A536AEE|nr:class I adenylate-forming enzyme family protein [Phenylobacterium sp.]MBL8552789.1 acyl--CoA ligase [Phenylobacterium sp.]
MFDAYVRDHAHWNPRAPAVISPGRTAGYAEFDADIDRCGAALAEFGVTPAIGVVSVLVDDPYLLLLVLAALARLGVVSSPYNDDAADLRLTDAGGAAPRPPARFLTREWQAAMFARAATPLPQLDLDPTATGRVMLSSGTTQAPRRLPLSWRRLGIGNHATLHSYLHGRVGTCIPLLGVDAMMGFSLLMGAWSIGAALTGGVTLEDLPGRLERLPPGVLSLTPAQLRQLLAILPPGFQPQPGWRVACGGSLLPPALAREARLRLTPDIRVIYGATEAGLSLVGDAADLEAFPGAVGYPPAGAIVEIVGDDGVPLPPGEPGHLRVRGDRMLSGYLGDPKATAERFRDGWFITGDVARRLADGRVVLEGRADDRMNLGGLKVMPAAIEEPALECPGVLDAACFAVPGPDGLDRAWLAVATVPGFDRDSLLAHLATYPAIPVPSFAWTEEIPRNDMGKVDRNRLREAVLGALAARPDAPPAGG